MTTSIPRNYSTEEASRILAAKPNTLRLAASQHGRYLGIRPVKLANLKWLWPADQVDAVARGETLSEVGV
jgi:hypothetical protein